MKRSILLREHIAKLHEIRGNPLVASTLLASQQAENNLLIQFGQGFNVQLSIGSLAQCSAFPPYLTTSQMASHPASQM